MIIDPVYEGKSMAGLIDLVRSGDIPAGLDRALRPPRRPARPQRLQRPVPELENNDGGARLSDAGSGFRVAGRPADS